MAQFEVDIHLPPPAFGIPHVTIAFPPPIIQQEIDAISVFVLKAIKSLEDILQDIANFIKCVSIRLKIFLGSALILDVTLSFPGLNFQVPRFSIPRITIPGFTFSSPTGLPAIGLSVGKCQPW